MDILGYQIDIARGGRGDVDNLKQWIERLAGYGYNTVMLYLEYRFQYPSAPALGGPDSLTPDGAAELDAFARQRNVELIPQFNCCGHNEGTCSLERYNHLCGGLTPIGKWGPYESLDPRRPEALDFVAGCYRDLAACFSSRYLHVGADEIRKMAAFMPDATDEQRMTVAFDFLKKVFDVVRELHRVPMIWADMLVKHPFTLQRVPKDVVLCDWTYGRPTKLETFRRFRDAGYRVLACPGTSTWTGHPATLLPPMNVPLDDTEEDFTEKGCGGLKNTVGLTREARDEQLAGVMLTTWQNDKGACQAFGWPVIYACAEVARGNDAVVETLWEDYPAKTWGVKDAKFGEFLDLVERRVPQCFVAAGERVTSWFFHIRDQIYRSHNPLPFLRELSRGVFRAERRAKARPLLSEAVAIAEDFTARATKNADEPRLWLDAAKLMQTMLDMGDEIDRMAAAYHAAAEAQFGDKNAFAAGVEEVCRSLDRFAELLGPFADWADLLIREHNQTYEEAFWPARAQRDLHQRAAGLRQLVDAGYPLIAFDRFITDIPATPTRVMWR